MEIKYKGNKMKQLLIFVFLILTSVSIAQTIDAPIGYTSFLGLRQYAYEANPGSDSLNANNTAVDNFAKASNDTVNAIKTRVNTVINLGASGGIIDGTVTWNDLATATKANVVQVTGSQSIAGIKTLTDNLNTENIVPTAGATYNLGSLANEWYRIYTRSLRTHTLVVVNVADTSEKAEISYNGTDVQFDRPVTVDTFNVSTMTALQLGSNTYTPALASDSILTIASTQSIVKLNPVYGNMTNVETIHMTDVTVGTIVYFYSKNATYTVVLKDNAADGNLKMAGDFTMGEYDSITFMYVKVATEQFEWMEISRSNN